MKHIIEVAKKKLTGTWVNSNDTIVFIFSYPGTDEIRCNVKYEIKNIKNKEMEYFLEMTGQHYLRLHLSQRYDPVVQTSFDLEFIGDDMLELTYRPDVYYTLLRVGQ